MKENTYIYRLRDVFVTLYTDLNSAQRVATEAGVSIERIDLSSNLINVWDNILREAIKIDKIERLLGVACVEYSENRNLRAAYEEYRDLIDSSGNIASWTERGQRSSRTGKPQRIQITEFVPPASVECPICGIDVPIPKFDRHWDNEVSIDRVDYNRVWSEGATSSDSEWDTKGKVICPKCGAQHNLVTTRVEVYLKDDFSCPNCKLKEHLTPYIKWEKVPGSLYTYQFQAEIVCGHCDQITILSKILPKLQKVAKVFIGKLRTIIRQKKLL